MVRLMSTQDPVRLTVPLSFVFRRDWAESLWCFLGIPLALVVCGWACRFSFAPALGGDQVHQRIVTLSCLTNEPFPSPYLQATRNSKESWARGTGSVPASCLVATARASSS